MQDFFKSTRFKILLLILALMVGFMVAAVYSGGSASILTQIVTVVTTPLQSLSTSISESVSSRLDKYLNAAHTYEENKILREQVNELRQQLVDYEQVRHEYEQLKDIEEFSAQRTDLTIETASVIGRDHLSPFYQFTIDKGSLDGIALHNTVITAEGLVGYVSEVDLTSAKIMTILDVNMNVGGSNSATRDVGNITGGVSLAEEGLCKMEYLPRDSETASGHVIVTSGSGIFPEGIVVGMVTEVSTSSLGNSLEATIRPAAEIRAVKDVFIITHFEGQGEE